MIFLIYLAWLSTALAEYVFNSDLESLINQKRVWSKKKYRPIYHVSAPAGWVTAPSGLTTFQEQYHLFYQCYPYEQQSGYTHWCHVITNNFIDWTIYPTALYPDKHYDRHGCLGGSALVHLDYLTLFYTGLEFVNNETVHTQNIAVSEDGYIFTKYVYNPVIQAHKHFEQRNPKVWGYRNNWYMLIGATTGDEGRLLLYTSANLFTWSMKATLLVSFGDMGYLWEHLDMFQLEGEHIVLLSVQGMQTSGYRFRNLYTCGYVVGQFNYLTMQFDNLEVSTLTFHELDYGHDFYAAKTVQALDGRTLLVAWLGMWESHYEELQYGWASMLTLVRELRITYFGRILMTPVREASDLRAEILENAWYDPGEVFSADSKNFELIVNSSGILDDAVITLEWGDNNKYSIGYYSNGGYMMVDRGEIDGVRRADWSPENLGHIHWRIFVDSSSIEVFCGEGDVVFSSRIYPTKRIFIRIEGKTQLNILQYQLRRSVSFDDTVKFNT